jgi:hypothetical protein
MTKTVSAIAILTTTIILSGCASSRVHFEEPIGARLLLEPHGTQMEGKEYKLPTAIDLPQKDNPATLQSDVGGRPVRMSLPDGTKLKGFLYVYKLNMDQVEKLAEVTFRLTDEQITKLRSGHAVTVYGYSARKRPVYKINLGLDR